MFVLYYFKCSKAYLQDLQTMQPILNQWQAYEPNLSEGLQAIGEAANTCAEAQRKLVENQKPSLTVVIALRILLRYTLVTFFSLYINKPLHEYRLYIEAAKDSLRNRDSAQIDYEVHMEQLCRVKAEQTQVLYEDLKTIRY